VGTEKRERQKANRAKRREEEAKAAKTTAAKRTALKAVVGIAAALAGVLLIAWIGGAFDGDDELVPVVTTPVTVPVAVTTAPATTTP
jgi:hypothetical protein